MKRWSLRHLFILALAVFVTTGMDLAAVQANGMAVKMAMASDRGASGHDGRADCPGGGDNGGAKAMICAALCAAPIWALLPATAPAMTAVPTATVHPAVTPVLRGRAPPPDPTPPRTTDIG